MKLSELTYQVVKNVKYLEDVGFTKEAFVNKDYNDDPDYINSINNAMAPINEAIHRLSDRNKIKFRVASLGIPNSNIVDISNISKKIKKIKNVFYVDSDGYHAVGYREYSEGFIFVQNVRNKPLMIQYIEDIPHFYLDDIYDDVTDVELYNYGINETMCSYIIEYALGKLQETIAPEMANLHVTQAEQYFDDLEEQQTQFHQEVIGKKYRI